MDDFFEKIIASENEFLWKNQKEGISLYLKREDLLHPTISGNKFRKLKYNLLEAKKQGKTKLLTFGGAFSNHIAATAAAGIEFGFETIGVIRGEELGKNLKQTLAGNPTLKFAVFCGMELCFLSRKEYREKESEVILNRLKTQFDDFYLLPEGGTNELAIKGCEEILSEEDKGFDYVCCPVGTGGTLSGIIKSAKKGQHILGFSALKNFPPLGELKEAEIIRNFHFGGYGKVNEELVNFINQFKQEYGILLDPVYTGKMLFGIFELLKIGFFRENTRILAIHTGGLQGIGGMNKVLQAKGMTEIQAGS